MTGLSHRRMTRQQKVWRGHARRFGAAAKRAITHSCYPVFEGDEQRYEDLAYTRARQAAHAAAKSLEARP